jgi:hypothetical protein
MIIATFKPSDRAATISYAMGSDRKTDQPDPREPVVLQGEPVLMDQFADRWSDFAAPHLAIAASCSEQLTALEARALWLRLIDLYLPGLRAGQVATLGILHREPSLSAAARSAVHGFIGHTCLFTGRRIQPYYHGSRAAIRLEVGQEMINLSRGWTSPKDLHRARVAVAMSPGPASPARQIRANEFTHQFRLFADEDLRDPSAIRVALTHSGAEDICLSRTARGRLRANFHCLDHDGLEMPVSLVLHPDRRDHLLRGSAIRDLIGPRLHRTPEVFNRMKQALLVELAHGREELDRRHGSSDAAYGRVFDWARRLELAVPARQSQLLTEVFTRIPNLMPPIVEPSADGMTGQSWPAPGLRVAPTTLGQLGAKPKEGPAISV